MTAWWSYILAPFGLLGLYLAGRKISWGWLVGLVTQSLWLAYSVQTRQYGFIPGTLAYAWIYLKNFLAWRREKKETETNDQDEDDPLDPGRAGFRRPGGRAGRLWREVPGAVQGRPDDREAHPDGLDGHRSP